MPRWKRISTVAAAAMGVLTGRPVRAHSTAPSGPAPQGIPMKDVSDKSSSDGRIRSGMPHEGAMPDHTIGSPPDMDLRNPQPQFWRLLPGLDGLGSNSRPIRSHPVEPMQHLTKRRPKIAVQDFGQNSPNCGRVRPRSANPGRRRASKRPKHVLRCWCSLRNFRVGILSLDWRK